MDRIKNSKILITGGAGFIGSNLVSRLIEDNEIVVVDDLSMGKIENLPQSNNLHFFEHSITDSSFMKRLLSDYQFDYIVLLAAVASVADTIERPLATHEVNQNANIQIIDYVRTEKLQVQKVLFASSAAVYGNIKSLPKKEDSRVDPLSPYAIDKYATERFMIDYGKLYGIPTVCTRFFNVYGPKQNPQSPYSGVLSLITDAIKYSKPFTLYGNGNQTRDFVYVDDVTAALELLLVNDRAMHDVYNVATGKETSLNTVIGKMENIFGKNLIKVNKDARIGDIDKSFADVSKLKELGYENEYDISDGLTKYIDFINRVRK